MYSRKPFGLCRSVCVRVFATIAMLSVMAVRLPAQQATGAISGTVLDSSGATVPNAQITITNQDTGTVRSTVSNNEGLYNVPQVPPGTYAISTNAQGFSPIQIKDVLVTVGSETRVDLKIVVGQVSQAITVTEAAPQVDTTSSSVGSLVDEQKVIDLPLNGRNWTDLTLMQPGISKNTTFCTSSNGNCTSSNGMTGTVYSSNGATMRSNNYLLDGAITQKYVRVE
jgi:hypothetical protein